ncbi:MAG TPA: sigma-70 family RNA polymerase sigma factor [Solirubrobacterales bacterium]|nr:sigma-70 family RNA polymerase sigma factor [Solirubrobacterales bacterium]
MPVARLVFPLTWSRGGAPSGAAPGWRSDLPRLRFPGIAAAPARKAEAEFARSYEAHFGAVLSYARRRTDRPEDAADLVAETFLVAWRRRADLPAAEEERRVWLYAVARRVLANQLRGERRRVRLAERLREDLATAVPSENQTQSESVAMKALSRIDERDREVLLLAGWEELGPNEIADVLEISPAAVRSRLHRARKRFKAELEVQMDSGERSEVVEAGVRDAE